MPVVKGYTLADKQRWAEKNDPAQPPSDASAIQAVTPSGKFLRVIPAKFASQAMTATGVP
jgi:hypothetical protein